MSFLLKFEPKKPKKSKDISAVNKIVSEKPRPIERIIRPPLNIDITHLITECPKHIRDFIEQTVVVKYSNKGDLLYIKTSDNYNIIIKFVSNKQIKYQIALGKDVQFSNL